MFVSSEVADLVREGRPAGVPKPQVLLPESQGKFAAYYNLRPFMFPHGLTGHALFEPPALLALARRMPDHRDHVLVERQTPGG